MKTVNGIPLGSVDGQVGSVGAADTLVERCQVHHPSKEHEINQKCPDGSDTESRNLERNIKAQDLGTESDYSGPCTPWSDSKISDSTRCPAQTLRNSEFGAQAYKVTKTARQIKFREQRVMKDRP